MFDPIYSIAMTLVYEFPVSPNMKTFFLSDDSLPTPEKSDVVIDSGIFEVFVN